MYRTAINRLTNQLIFEDASLNKRHLAPVNSAGLGCFLRIRNVPLKFVAEVTDRTGNWPGRSIT
jgi:hypothetical protein